VNPVRASTSTSAGGQRHAGQHPGQLVAQLLGLGGDVLGGQRRDDQLAVVGEADLARVAPAALGRVLGQLGLQVGQGGVQFLLRGGQRVGRGGRLADQAAELRSLRRPRLGGERFRFWILRRANQAQC
jgi:hypothetical protein